MWSTKSVSKINWEINFYVNFNAGKPSVKLLLQTAVTVFAKNRGCGYGTVPVTALVRTSRAVTFPMSVDNQHKLTATEMCADTDG
jgi:hypothetical protein